MCRMSRQERCCLESLASTWHRVAAKPLRVTCSTRRFTGSGAIASTASWSTSTGTPAPTRAPSSMSPLAPADASTQSVTSPRPGPGGAARDPGGEHARAVAVVDVDHGHPGRARVEHGQQGGQPAEGGAVPDAGGDRDHGHAGQSSDDGGQRALHARHHDQAVRPLELVADREQPVQSGHADVADLVDAGPVDAGGERGLGGDGSVGGPGTDHRDGALGLGYRAERGRTGDEVDVGVELPDGVQRRVAEPGGEDRAVGVLRVERAQDGDHLVGGLPGAVDHLGVAGAGGAVEVDPGEAQVFGAGVVAHPANLSPATSTAVHRPARCHCRRSGVG